MMSLSAVNYSEPLGKSYALRLLIHFIGDIHQPLHCSDRVNSEFPSGDKGGNEFPIPYHYSADELHATYDNTMYTLHKSVKRPFTSETWQDFADVVTPVFQNVTGIQPSDYENFDYLNWAEESYQIASSISYVNITENEFLPLDYQHELIDVLQTRLVLAAYRLYYLIDTIYGVSSENIDHTIEQVVQDQTLKFLNDY
jgi:hypothetical protein